MLSSLLSRSQRDDGRSKLTSLTSAPWLQGEIRELCDWTVDLGVLPRFEQNAEASGVQGFYTGEYDERTLGVVYPLIT